MNDLPNTPDPSDCLQITVIEFVNRGQNWKDWEVVHVCHTFQGVRNQLGLTLATCHFTQDKVFNVKSFCKFYFWSLEHLQEKSKSCVKTRLQRLVIGARRRGFFDMREVDNSLMRNRQ